MIKGIALGGLAMVVLGAGGVTGYKTLMKPKFAEVVSVKEITETVVTPREQCEDVQVQHQAPVKDENRIVGTVAGVPGRCCGNLAPGAKPPLARTGRDQRRVGRALPTFDLQHLDTSDEAVLSFPTPYPGQAFAKKRLCATR